MKKQLITATVAITIALISGCMHNTPSPSSTHEDSLVIKEVNLFSSYETATVNETLLNDSLAWHFPQTLLFQGKISAQGTVLFFNTLPRTLTLFKEQRQLFEQMSWINITLLKRGNHTAALLPRHAFHDEDVIPLMEQTGMTFDSTKDLVSMRFKKIDQAISASLFDTLDGKKLDGSPCIVRTLNRTGTDGDICQYVIKGMIHWVDDTVKARLDSKSTTSGGGKITPMTGKGMFVVRVPNELSDKIPGMSGGSVVVRFADKDYLLGMNTERIKLIATIDGKQTFITMLAVQTIVGADIKDDN